MTHVYFRSLLRGAGYGLADGPTQAAPREGSALAVFEHRILPIFNSPKPSSCSECLLSGVDLKDYIRPTQAETFTSLVRAGLVDTRQPTRRF